MQTKEPKCEWADDEFVEKVCRSFYGEGWDGPPEKQPGEKMKANWREYARRWIKAIDEAETWS